MHALRIAHQGQELLTTGRITLPIVEPERHRLMQVRRGEVALPGVHDRLNAQSAQLEHAVFSADLPDEPDHDAVNRFLVGALRARLGWRSPPRRDEQPTVSLSTRQGAAALGRGVLLRKAWLRVGEQQRRLAS